MKLFTVLFGMLIGIIFVHADEFPSENMKTNSLYMFSTSGDFVGQGRIYVYKGENEERFSINQRRDGIAVHVSNSDDHWSLEFASRKNQILQPGVYKNAVRSCSRNEGQPGLDIAGCGRGCNELNGFFEVLEIKYTPNGDIESFAANFVQRCGEQKKNPLIGSIRYNSAIPPSAHICPGFQRLVNYILYFNENSQSVEQEAS